VSILSLKRNRENIWIHIFFILACLSFIVPFILVISISISNEDALYQFGYKLIPKQIDLTAYKFVFQNPVQMRNSYIVTAFQAVLGTFLAVLIMSLCAYPLSRKDFKLRGILTFVIFFTMLFGGGLIPSYILITQYLHLGDTVWVYIFPALVNAFQIIVFRTFFQGLPESLQESAKIDGASELRIFFQIILPLSKPVLATIALFNMIDRWNNWYTSLLYINKQELYTLQYMLQKILREADFVNSFANELPAGIDFRDFKIPTESMRYAMLVIAAGPMLVVYPFFQKYFSRGLTIGAVKG
jgi:putative aldouronate transport system permease protein